MRFFFRFVFGLSFASLVIWGGYYFVSRYDVALDPEFYDYFPDDHFNYDHNFHVAWAGIYAPDDVSDLYAYGVQVVRGDIEAENTNALRFDDMNIDEYSFCLEQDDYVERGDACTKAVQLSALLESNKLLLKRYRDLVSNTSYQVSVGNFFGIKGTFASDVMSLHRLLILRLIHMSQHGNSDQAIEEWARVMAGLQHIRSGKITLVGQAVWMVIYNMHLRALPVIFLASEDPDELLSVYHNDIRDVLEKRSREFWDIRKTLQADYNAFRLLSSDSKVPNSWTLKVNVTRNLYVRLMRLWMDLFSVSAHDFNDETIALYNDKLDASEYCMRVPWMCLGYNITGYIVIKGTAKGGEMMQNADYNDTYQNVLMVWMDAKVEGVSDEGMEDYIQNVDPALYNSLTQKPFQWDNDKRSIYFLHNNDVRQDIYY